MKYQVAAIQLDTQANKEKNLNQVAAFIDEACRKQAKLICLPEVFNVIDDGVEAPETIEAGRSVQLLKAKAKQHSVWLHSGSFAEYNPAGKKFNTSVLINPQGEVAASYRKIHLFDVTLPDGTEKGESKRYAAGDEIVVADTELGKLGLTICYDIRFPELYRVLALQGAQVMLAPANFTLPTGKDHWETILRTRAIESGAYVIAANQIGTKYHGGASYGSSMIVDPWGVVVARSSERPGVICAEIDLAYVDKIRGMIPSLKNRRADVYQIQYSDKLY